MWWLALFQLFCPVRWCHPINAQVKWCHPNTYLSLVSCLSGKSVKNTSKSSTRLWRRSTIRFVIELWYALHWRHNDHGGVSNHQPHSSLLNRLFGCRSKKTSKLRIIGLCAGNSPGPVNSPHKGSVTWKMFPFDDVIMACWIGHVSLADITGTNISLKQSDTYMCQ